MRFLRLDLRRYGPFTDKHLHFRDGAPLHLVYGANEAGKSSALAAIGDLLFGFPQRRQQDFLHDAGALRVGAELAARKGSVLRFRRRRGNKNTLLADDPDEPALPDDALLPFLGALGRDDFERAFGLDSHTLRAGGEAMLASEGEVGSSLFAAASGLTDLARLRRDLDSEADQIFAARASKDRRFYQALDRYQAALKAERENELKAGDWKRLNAEIEEIEGALETVRAQRLDIANALARLNRLKQLAPILAAIDRDTALLGDFADLPEVPAGFIEAARAALAGVAAAGQEAQAAETARRDVAQALEAIALDEAMLAQADAVVELFSRKGDYLSKRKDLPRIERERDEFAEQLARMAQRLGLAAPDELMAALPSVAAIEDGQALLDEGRQIEQAIAAEEVRLRAELSTEADQQKEFAVGVSDPKPLRDRLAALAPDLRRLEERDALEGRLGDLKGRLEDGLRRLSPPVADFDKLAQSPLPARAAIETHRTGFRALAERERSERERFAANRADAAEVESQLGELTASGAVSYAEAIRTARDDRRVSFDALKTQLLGGAAEIAPAETETRIARYEELEAAADALADQAIADAHRTSRLADLHQRAAALEAARAESAAALAAIGDEKIAAEARFAALFAGTGVAPEPPEAMLDWLAAAEALLAVRREAAALAGQLAGLDRLAGEVRGALVPLAEAAGTPDAGGLAPLALGRLVTGAVAEMGERWTAQVRLDGMRRATSKRIGEIEEALEGLRRAEAGWREKYRALLDAIRLPAESSLAAADKALAAWAAIPDLQREWANRAARVEGMARDIAGFEAEVRVLAEKLAPDLAELPPHALVDRLRESADAARAGKARHDDARQRLAAAAAAVVAARAAQAEAETRQAAMLAALPAGAEPLEALDRLDRRAALRQRLAAQWTAFREAADGMDEAAVRQDLEGYDSARAPLDAEDLGRRDDALHQQNNELYARLGQKRAERERLEAGTGAELAAFERRGAEAEIVANARQWAVRRIAAAMLAGAIEQYREAQSDPLMRRAGALFAALTSGSFTGLSQDYGEDDKPRLVGVRPDGARVDIAGLSEGSRDQLYLALRLAYVEDHARHAEPLPFIGDDIFQTFDDERTAAGISALAAGARAFQPILFTHHLSVVAIARKVLGAELDYIEL